MTDPAAALLDAQLALVDGALAARIRASRALPVDGEGRPCVRRHRTLYPLPLSPHRLEAAWAGAPAVPRVLLGVGLGELVDRALETRPADAPPLVAWEASPAVLRAALSRRDWRAPLADGRLRLALGTDLLDHSDVAGAPGLLHPVLAPHHPWVAAALREGFDRPRAVVRQGGLLVHEIARVLADRGLQPWLLDFAALGWAQATADLRRLAPAVVLGVNHMVGLPELCARVGVPLVEWEIDPSTERLPARTGPVTTTRIATWRRRHVPVYRQAGFPEVEHLPLSADTALRRPVALADDAPERPRAAVTFVGNSLVEQAAAHGRRARALLARYLAARGDRASADAVVQALLQLQRRRMATWMIPQLLEARCPGLDVYLRREGILEHPAQLLGELVGAEWRLNVVAACAPVGIEVWGDPGWSTVDRPGVTLRGPAGARDQLTRIYGAAHINLDIGRAYQRDIVTLRVFDALACGGFVLAEHSDELADCFEPGVEVAVWRGVPDLRAQLQRYTADPDARARIAEAGRRRVLRDHRLQDRVAGLLERAGVAHAGHAPPPAPPA